MIYTFKCPNCKEKQEIAFGINDTKVAFCNKCKKIMERVYDVPHIRFKGKGFHSNDYRRKK